MVAGDVPDRRRLLLDAGLPARHRGAGRRPAVPDRDAGAGRRHPAGCPPRLSPRGRREPARPGVDRDAGAPAALLARQDLRAGAPRLRDDRLRDHDDALRRGRVRARHREPLRPALPARPGALDHPGAAGPARGGVPARVQRGDRCGGRARGHLPGPQRGGALGLPVADRDPPVRRTRLGSGADHGARQPGDDGGGRPDGLPPAGARAVRLRDRRGRDAARERRPPRTPKSDRPVGSAAPRSCSPGPRC